MLRPNLTWIYDMEGATVPADLPYVVDAHVDAAIDDLHSLFFHPYLFNGGLGTETV